ncbi:MAG: ABC transporter permease, partial [Patescibacteria group bacterium]
MNLNSTFRTALRALRSNVGRSLLTILGIVIGIVAIVLVVSLGQGAQSLILNQIQSIGGNTLIIRPGREPHGPTDAAETILSDSLRARDVAALENKQSVPGLTSVDPAILVPGPVSYQSEVFRPTTLGWTAEGPGRFFNIYPNEGEMFSDADVQGHAKVTVLGARVKEELFGESDAVGEFVRISGQNFRVVGVFAEIGQIGIFNADELVILPYTTAQKEVLGISHFHEILARAADEADVNEVADDIRATLRDLHGITDPDKDDFFVLSQQDIVRRISTITNALTVFLVAIASIALVVGGVGIMNIMLVSVAERTREIGLRKALGATNSDIQKQFLLESVLLTGSGGVVGTLLAFSLAALVTFIVRTRFSLDWPFAFPLLGVVLGVGVATLIGLIFGIYPAR